MFRLQGPKCKDLCDPHLEPTRRDVLRVGGSGILGLTLGGMFHLQARSAESSSGKAAAGSPGWGKAKSIIMVYLQGGPSHLDLWDPKRTCPITSRASLSRSRRSWLEFITRKTCPSWPRSMTSSR